MTDPNCKTCGGDGTYEGSHGSVRLCPYCNHTEELERTKAIISIVMRLRSLYPREEICLTIGPRTFELKAYPLCINK